LRATVLSAVVLVLLRLALIALHRIVQRGFALSAELKRRYPGLEARSNRYLPAFERLLQVVLYFVAVLWLLEIWGVDSFGWLASDFGQRLTGSIVTIIVMILVAALVLEILDAVIHRYLAPKDAYGRPVMRSARVRTLLPLLRNALRILLTVMVTLVVLSELGINIAPLLAGAGVVGLAIGFGAQTLVKDVITGFFILAEDTLSVGDVADIDGNVGVVEVMTIRTIRLRDASGTVYTIPFSAVTTVKNLTKDFSFALFNIGVAYDSDVDEVIELMRAVAKDMREDPEFRYMILEDLEVMGLNQFADSALILMARLRTPPGKQWPVSREFNRRLKILFDEHGVEFPFPQRTIHMINDTPARRSKHKEAGDPGEDAGGAEDDDTAQASGSHDMA
jgi:small conductance mechanosensitive channel